MMISSRAELEGAQTSTWALGVKLRLITTGGSTFSKPKTSEMLPSSHGFTWSLRMTKSAFGILDSKGCHVTCRVFLIDPTQGALPPIRMIPIHISTMCST